jgi:hypothetical protein
MRTTSSIEGRLAGFLSQQLGGHIFKRYMLVMKLKTKSHNFKITEKTKGAAF